MKSPSTRVQRTTRRKPTRRGRSHKIWVQLPRGFEQRMSKALLFVKVRGRTFEGAKCSTHFPRMTRLGQWLPRVLLMMTWRHELAYWHVKIHDTKRQQPSMRMSRQWKDQQRYSKTCEDLLKSTRTHQARCENRLSSVYVLCILAGVMLASKGNPRLGQARSRLIILNKWRITTRSRQPRHRRMGSVACPWFTW